MTECTCQIDNTFGVAVTQGCAVHRYPERGGPTMTDTDEAQERVEDWTNEKVAEACWRAAECIEDMVSSGLAIVDGLNEAARRLRARQREEGDEDWIRGFVSRQEYLSPEDAELLQDNLWSLYQTTDATPQREEDDGPHGDLGWQSSDCVTCGAEKGEPCKPGCRTDNCDCPTHRATPRREGEGEPVASVERQRPLHGLLIHLLSVEHADGGVTGVRLRLEWGDPEAPGPYRTEEVRVGAGMAGEVFVDTEPPAERSPVAWLVRAWHPEWGWHENVHRKEEDAEVTFRWYSGHPINEDFERVQKTPLYSEAPVERENGSNP